MKDKLLEVIQKNKIILVLSENSIGKKLYHQLMKISLEIVVYINIPETSTVENLSEEKKYLFLLDGFAEDGRYENIYLRFGLDKYDAKVVIVCRASLISHYRDPSLYFVPVKNGRLQKKSFTKYETLDLNRNKLFLEKSSSNIKKEENPKNTEKILDLKKHYLNKKLMTNNKEMMHGLADRIEESEGYKEFLFKLVYLSRDNKEMQIAAANAISALNAARVSFSGKDLSGIQIPSADLTGIILRDALVCNANFTGVKLNLAVLTNADFTGTVLFKVDFGEYPTLETGDWGKSFFWFDAKNNLMAAGCDIKERTIKIYDYNSQKVVKILPSQDFDGGHCHVTQDGTLLIYSNFGLNASQLWDIEESVIRATISLYIEAIALSIDKKFLATKGHYDEVHIIDATNGKLLHFLVDVDESNGNVIYSEDSLVFAKNNHYFASSKIHTGEILVWDVPSFRKLLTLPTPSTKIVKKYNEIYEEGIIEVYGIDFNPESTLLAAGYGLGKIVLWEMPSGNCIRQFEGHNHFVYSLKFNQEGNVFFSGSADGSVRLWDSTTGSFIALLLESRQLVSKLRLNQDSTRIAVETGGTVTFIPVTTQLPMLRKGHADIINGLCFNSEGSCLATAGEDWTICIWSINPMNLVAKIDAPGDINKLVFSQDGNNLYGITEYRNTVVCYDTKTWKFIFEKKIDPEEENNLISNVNFSYRGNSIMYRKKHKAFLQETEKEVFYVSNIDTLKNFYTWQTLNEDSSEGIMASAVSTDNTLMAAAYYNNYIRIISIDNNNYKSFYIPEDKKDNKRNESKISCMFFSRNSRILAVGTSDGLIYLIQIDTKNTTLLKRIQLNEKEDIRSIVYSNNAKVIFVTASKSISIWSITGKCYSYIAAAHISSINQIDINQTKNILASVAYDQAISLWKINHDFSLEQIWTSRPLLNCVGAKFSEDNSLEPMQINLIRERGGCIDDIQDKEIVTRKFNSENSAKLSVSIGAFSESYKKSIKNEKLESEIFKDYELNINSPNKKLELAKGLRRAATITKPKHHADKISHFILLGVDINSQNAEGKTALHEAIRKNNVPFIKELLKNGARYNIPDNTPKEKTAYDYAKDLSSPEIFNLFLQHINQ